MGWRTFAVAAVCSLSSIAGAVQEKAKDDSQLIQGQWSWDPAVKQSDAIPPVLVERVVIKGDTLTFHYSFDGKEFASSPSKFKLNPKASPKEIDFTPTQGNNKDKTYRGLYEIKAGKLRIGYRGPGSTRPKDWDDKVDPATNGGTMFLVLLPSAR